MSRVKTQDEPLFENLTRRLATAHFAARDRGDEPRAARRSRLEAFLRLSRVLDDVAGVTRRVHHDNCPDLDRSIQTCG